MGDKFRKKKEPRHLRLYHSITGCEAWRHLSGSAIKVLIAMARFDDGSSNGRLYFSERVAAKETNLSRNTVRRAINELIEKGFIRCTKPGAFNRNNLEAATYRLTWVAWPGGSPAAPTRDFENWKPENSQAQFLTGTGSNIDTELETASRLGSNIEPPCEEKPLIPDTGPRSKTEPQIVYQGDRRSKGETAQRKQANSSGRAFLGSLRQRLAEHLAAAEPGEQTRLSITLGIPGSTLSKFLSGRNLPDAYAPSLARALFGEAA